MNRGLALLLGLLVVMVIGQGLWIWRTANTNANAGLEVRATNAGIELSGADGHIAVFAGGRANDLVAEGELGEVLDIAPGTYDVQVSFTRASDAQIRWLRDLELAGGQTARGPSGGVRFGRVECRGSGRRPGRR